MRSSFAVVALVALFGGCGARTAISELVAPRPDADVPDVSAPDASTPDASSPDAGRDAGSDAAAIDAAIAIDASRPRDASVDAPPAPPIPCPAGLGAEAYVWGGDGVLSRFDPVTLATTRLGRVDCEGLTQVWTFSISRTGIAYMMYQNWGIYAVDLATLACTRTPYDRTQLGLDGQMAIAVSRDADAERMFVYGEVMEGDAGHQAILGVSDLVSFVPSPVANVVTTPVIFPADMQADAQGHIDLLSYDGFFTQLDARDGRPLRTVGTTFRSGSGGWAILPYDERILFFGSPDGAVWEFDITSGGLTYLGSVGFAVVGASAAACIHH